MNRLRAAWVTKINQHEIKVTLVGGQVDITHTVHTWEKVEELLRCWIIEGKEI